MSECGYKQTLFDTLVTNRKLQLIKAVLPYIGYDSVKIIALMVKLEELKNAMNLRESSFRKCSDKPFDTNDFFSSIKDYLSDEESEMIDSILGMMDLFSMDEGVKEEMFGSYMDMFKEMF